MFTPVFAVARPDRPAYSAVSDRIALDYYSMISSMTEFAKADAFAQVMFYILPFVALIAAVGLFVYLLSYYLSGKKFKVRYAVVLSVLSFTIIITLLSGASALSRNMRGDGSTVAYAWYYFLLVLNVVMFILRPVVGAVEAHRKNKEAAAGGADNRDATKYEPATATAADITTDNTVNPTDAAVKTTDTAEVKTDD
jgi:hypothetical protein